MFVIESIAEMKAWSKKKFSENKTIGFVPTMGYFHEGHLTLIKESKKQCDTTVVSIYVNPTQFGPHEDYDKYPRDLERDLNLAEELAVDVVFVPADAAMYPPDYSTFVRVEKLEDKLCGRSRPGHFRGVATVVLKLLHIVNPTILFLGKKDAQQAILLQRMVKDLNMDVAIHLVDTVRETDGLAMSSRNTYLSPEERKAAPVLYRSLQLAKEMIEKGERNSAKIISAMQSLISKEPLAKIDYISIVDCKTLEDIEQIDRPCLIALAVYIGTTRLIDNLWLCDAAV